MRYQAKERKEHFLNPLFDELGIVQITSKRIMAALVMQVLRNNDCGVTKENEGAIIKKLLVGMCSTYEFQVFEQAAIFDNDLLEILCKHEPQIDPSAFYTRHVWPFLRENEVIPGVRL